MNIFFLHEHPRLAAQAHCDSHVIKMVLETAQILSTTHAYLSSEWAPYLYRPTHVHHPSLKWTRASSENYQWLYTLFTELHEEFMFRRGKSHESFLKLSEPLSNVPGRLAPRGLLPPFLALPDRFKQHYDGTWSNAVELYREYYRSNKVHLHQWTKRKEPTWI